MFTWLNTNFPNWKTTAAGLFMAASLAANDYVKNGGHFTWTGMLSAVGAGALGYLSKYWNTTGGKVPATLEAENRVVKDEKLEAKLPEVK